MEEKKRTNDEIAKTMDHLYETGESTEATDHQAAAAEKPDRWKLAKITRLNNGTKIAELHKLSGDGAKHVKQVLMKPSSSACLSNANNSYNTEIEARNFVDFKQKLQPPPLQRQVTSGGLAAKKMDISIIDPMSNYGHRKIGTSDGKRSQKVLILNSSGSHQAYSSVSSFVKPRCSFKRQKRYINWHCDEVKKLLSCYNDGEIEAEELREAMRQLTGVSAAQTTLIQQAKSLVDKPRLRMSPSPQDGNFHLIKKINTNNNKNNNNNNNNNKTSGDNISHYTNKKKNTTDPILLTSPAESKSNQPIEYKMDNYNNYNNEQPFLINPNSKNEDYWSSPLVTELLDRYLSREIRTNEDLSRVLYEATGRRHSAYTVRRRALLRGERTPLGVADKTKKPALPLMLSKYLTPTIRIFSVPNDRTKYRVYTLTSHVQRKRKRGSREYYKCSTCDNIRRFNKGARGATIILEDDYVIKGANDEHMDTCKGISYEQVIATQIDRQQRLKVLKGTLSSLEAWKQGYERAVQFAEEHGLNTRGPHSVTSFYPTRVSAQSSYYRWMKHESKVAAKKENKKKLLKKPAKGRKNSTKNEEISAENVSTDEQQVETMNKNTAATTNDNNDDNETEILTKVLHFARAIEATNETSEVIEIDDYAISEEAANSKRGILVEEVVEEEEDDISPIHEQMTFDYEQMESPSDSTGRANRAGEISEYLPTLSEFETANTFDSSCSYRKDLIKKSLTDIYNEIDSCESEVDWTNFGHRVEQLKQTLILRNVAEHNVAEHDVDDDELEFEGGQFESFSQSPGKGM